MNEADIIDVTTGAKWFMSSNPYSITEFGPSIQFQSRSSSVSHVDDKTYLWAEVRAGEDQATGRVSVNKG